ncbi:hypothetical protein TREMEDRAFT_65446 [Tremella mesenterica DSM 1558]|uniref:uncharacterized protein n=1 Tax=Tremella mesenterica (strain ATCC 24925 / CBS 8224 / DSM 1558 / NBRC 9311 / NRRL Y-6157 / RJB 2259-6 / UBC 559-6) TaxID=578456 RepID=UPI00032C7A61|nr:uncharacterized protein TREMEDRAFT_65446 [Tremella mesenterica DSM 1558]EIW66578.1 hypothetical protein TREMEDRAFT_65446 [Tremella mesenterica DSM 1558]
MDPQVVLKAGLVTVEKIRDKSSQSIIFRENLLILPILAIFSLLVLILVATLPRIYRFTHKRLILPLQERFAKPYHAIEEEDEVEDDQPVPPTPIYAESQGLLSDFKAHIRSLREYGTILFALEVVRTLCLAALLGLSIYAAIQAETPEKADGPVNFIEILKKKKHKHKNKHKNHHDKLILGEYSLLELGEFGVCGFYAYTLIASFLLLTLRPATPLRRHVIAHVDALLALAFVLYAYRDLWPLLTYHIAPSDLQNPITWARISLLTVVAVVIPLIRPRTYVPADPENPSLPDDVAPEQTAPWLSFLFHEYMSSLVWKAWKTPSLPYEALHPLPDGDRSKLLYDKHMDKLDPYRRKRIGKRPRHLFFSLLETFKLETVVICLMAFLAAVTELAGSVAINQLLNFLEKNGKNATIRPFVWIALLVVGPAFNSVFIQMYIWLTTRSLVRAESLLTQLLFDHALRLRMKDTTEEKTEEIQSSPPIITIEGVVQDVPGTPGSSQNGNGPNSTAEESIDATEIGSASDSNKGKKAETAAANAKEAADVEAQKSKGQGLAGKINVLMAADVDSVLNGRDLALVFIYTPTQILLSVVLLYRILSWSSIIGIMTLVATLPLPGLITKRNAQFQQQRMLATDSRVDTITEAINSASGCTVKLRMVKMFAWEDRMKERISAKREVELDLIWRRRLMTLSTVLLNNILPVLTMAVTFTFYTAVQKRQLTAAAVFTSMTVFELLKSATGMCFYLINEFVTGYVSIQRINKFLLNSEMIDEFTTNSNYKDTTVKPASLIEAKEQGLIRFHNASFTWGTPEGHVTPGFSLSIPDVTFVKGKVNLITGPTGSGKSSLLKALIGELHFIPGIEGFFHLPREGGVSYAAQESWCLSETIKDNILFGEPYEDFRYKKVLRDCALEADLKLFDDGDQTEIGEKGITLSGGQKARVTLARAVYAKTAVVLLDDIFSALDTLTSRWIIDHLFQGELMQGRTVLLITHHIGLAAPMSDYMIALNGDGTIRTQGPIDQQLIEIEQLKEGEEEVEEIAEEIAPPETKTEEKKVGSKLVQAEEKGEGRISRKALVSFFSTFGGPVFWLTYIFLLTSGQAMSAFQTWWLGRWAKEYDNVTDTRQVSIIFWLGLYFVWVLVGIATLAAGAILYYVGAIKASRTIHRKLVDRIFGAYMRFLDATPVGRIISRFTKDMKAIDGQFIDVRLIFGDVMDITLAMLIKLAVVISLVPLFSVPSVIIGVIGGIIGELYIHGQLSVKREMSNAKSPLFSHFSAAVSGIVSIRAYGAQEKLRAEARRRADKYTRTARVFYNLNRWVTIRIDLLGGLFAAGLAAFLVYGPHLDASTSGFALSQAISFSGMILWWVRMVNELEVQGNSVERVEDYLVIDQEPSSEESKQPPAAWPTSGEIVLDKLSAKYSQDGPIVLAKLEVRIASGEKVGIVGRTGSGKSTLALALLRMIPTSGDVVIDGLKTSNVNLHALRSNITIIPQDPDPFGEHDDAELNDAMQSSGLGQARHSESGAATPQRLTLDTPIAAGGGNLSQGQRQLVALARALVRASKVLILDEATASVDFETDALIQKSIRSLPQSCTVLTVAHRLSTVMDYDKILVLGGGKLLEYDSPENLKGNKDSYFAKLVQAMDG